MSSSTRINKIGTHDGCFYANEVLACWMLKKLYKDAEIIRTRDVDRLSECDVLVGVGDVFDAKALRFDHHQRGFAHTMQSLGQGVFTTKLSSAGLVYAHFGKDLLHTVALDGTSAELYASVMAIVFKKVYRDFIEEIDAVDNGVNAYDVAPKFEQNSHLSRRVPYMNPPWNKPDMDEDFQFELAMELAGKELLDRIDYFINSWLPARKIVAKALAERFKV